MSNSNKDGRVNSKGESAIRELSGDPQIYDMVAAAEGMRIAPEVEEKIHDTMKLLVSETQEAKFLLDIYFNEERSAHKPFGGFLMAWTNGGFASGGGDEKVYFCPNVVYKNDQKMRCAAPMPPNLMKHGTGLCLACKSASRDRNLIGEVYFKVSMENWVHVIQRYFYRLECNSDIRIGMMRRSLRQASSEEQGRQMGGDRLEGVRNQREFVRYKLASLIKDGSAGATLESRIRAFLNA